MFKTHPYRRLNGLTDAHLLSASLRDPMFLATLPFDQNRIPRYITDNVLFRTRERWKWFSDAQKLNPVLGTLGYLPAEVRLLIWQILLQCQDTLSLDGLWEYYRGYGPPFQLSAYYFGFGRRGQFLASVENLRLVSSQVKAEFDYVFLYMRTFRFNYAENLSSFMGRLKKDTYLEQLSSVELAICYPTQYSIEAWLESISYLPSTLKRVQFSISHVPPNWYSSETRHEPFERIGQMVGKTAQRAPNAQISISSTPGEQLEPTCQAFVESILAKVRYDRLHLPALG